MTSGKRHLGSSGLCFVVTEGWRWVEWGVVGKVGDYKGFENCGKRKCCHRVTGQRLAEAAWSEGSESQPGEGELAVPGVWWWEIGEEVGGDRKIGGGGAAQLQLLGFCHGGQAKG